MLSGTTPMIKRDDECQSTLQCLPAGPGNGTSPGTRGDREAKSLWELSIDPKRGDMGRSRCLKWATGRVVSSAGVPRHTASPFL